MFAPEARKDLGRLDGRRRTEVLDRLERHLRHEPTKESKSRIKRLRGMEQPQYRLRVQDIRVFHDVAADAVEILAIVAKADADDWVRDEGTPT